MPVYKILVLIECVDSEHSEEPAQSGQSISSHCIYMQ